MKLDHFIESLSAEVAKARRPCSPSQLITWMVPFLAIYLCAAQFVLGFRPDIALQLRSPLFITELLLLFALLVSSLIAVGALAYPDLKQSSYAVAIPMFVCLCLVLLGAIQLVFPSTPTEVLPEVAEFLALNHKIECTVTIAFVSAFPFVLLFALLRRGASVKPGLAGSYIVMASAAFGALTLRLAESNDSLAHLLCWHYLPILVVFFIGAQIGRRVLRW